MMNLNKMTDSSASISNQTTSNNNNNTNSMSNSSISARRLDKRSKSLASASTIIDGVHSVMTSASRSSSKTSRPSLALRAPTTNHNTTDHTDDFHDNIVKSIQQSNLNIHNTREQQQQQNQLLHRTPTHNNTDMKFIYSITNIGNSPEVSKTSKLQKSASILANSCNNKDERVASVSPTSPSTTNTINSTPAQQKQQQQQPTINIISNPNFEQEAMEVTNDLNVNTGPSSDTSNYNSDNTTTTTAATTTKGKSKRNSSSLSSSLRHLITITFNRSSSSASGSNSTTNANASASHSSKSTSIKRDKKSSLQKRNSSSKQSKLSKDSGTSANGALVPQQNQTKQPMENSIKDDFPKRSSLSQNASAFVGDETSNSSRRQTTSSDRGKTPEENNSDQQRPSWTPPDDADIAEIDGKTYIECPLCVLLVSECSTPQLESCRHRVCLECMQRYITTEINHSRLNITCPICSEPIHPNTIKSILQNEKYYLKYESFMLRRVLAAEPDARWCPAPDCGYVVLANGCASCPKLVCGRDGCNTSFCYHCKQEWHPNQTCSAASIQRNKRVINAYNIGDLIEESTQAQSNRKSSKSSQKTTSIRVDDIKECPVCASRIIKMNDGSCNHMKCSICETEFCWLCMKEISDLHYFSPSGCTFWGKKPWSRKKKFLWHLGMLVGAPICIILIAGIAVPAIVIGIPVWAARKLHNRLERKPFSRYRKNAIITGGVLLSFVISPIISAVALAIGIPILLGYVYGVVPLSLCRSSGGCLSPAASLENLQHDFQAARNQSAQARDGISIDTATSHRLGDPSIGETSLYMSNISLETNSIGHVTTVERDRESASNAALAGSIISNNADDGNSTRALAGSIISKESGYTLVPAEVHNNAVFAAVTTNQAMADSISNQAKCTIRTK